MSSSPKVAIVHDWLVGGGAEAVVLELHKMFPEAPIYTSYCSPEWRKKLNNKVVTGFLQNWPFSRLRKFLPVLRIWWFSRLDLSGFDLVISSSGNGEAKGVKTSDSTTHVCYCHSPVHFYWRHYDQYIKNPGFGAFTLNWLVRLSLKILVDPLRRWDYKAAQRPDFFIANSTHIQSDIKKFYKRESTIIYPPVNIKRFKNNSTNRHGFVTVGRQVPYKHTEIIIEACNQLGLDLTVVGDGPQHNYLKKIAGPTIKFDNKASDEAVKNYLARSEAFIFAAHEDFGITPVEALASGTPVIAYKAGGALDYIVEGETGLFFEKQTVKSLTKALKKFNFKDYKPGKLLQIANEFSQQNFQKKIKKYLKSATEE